MKESKLEMFEADLRKLLKQYEVGKLIQKDEVIIAHTLVVILGTLKTFNRND